ncbi:MAG TPA: hypothetical protein PKL77_04765 [Candidatus Omnitrophota bacterium]|nr:hypothetical protein [Candidatus Omnitrophota bacterium]HPT07708.1 hypothetical protein [Candidatus Omnitrophota bacterium]
MSKNSGFCFCSWLLVVLAALVALEIGVRICIFNPFFPVKKLRIPELYASYWGDDDYWKLYHAFKGPVQPPASVYIHPILGWSQKQISADNQLGLRKDTISLFTSPGKHILFYGDSFVDGAVSLPEYEIPAYITNRLHDASVIDLSVGGYGFDQMYLLFVLTHTKITRPFVVFGLLVEDDLDRSILSFRTGQKPYFALKHGELVLQGIPIDPVPAHYLARHQAHIPSYAFRLFFRSIIGRTSWGAQYPARIDEKKLVTTKIVEKIEALCKDRGYPVLFVLFHSQYDLASGGYWQETFLKELFRRKQIPYVDTAEFLRAYVREHGVPLGDFYDTTGVMAGHHNDLGNRVIAEGLQEYFAQWIGS